MNVCDESFFRAVQFGEVDLVKELIRKGANLEAVDENGKRPLHVAIICGHNKVLDILIAHKCDVNSVVVGLNCLHWKTARLSPLYTAIQYRNRIAFEALLEAGADVNAANAEATPLQLCATLNLAEPALVLINKQAKVDEIRGNLTALHQAVTNGSIEMAEILLSHGASANIKDLLVGVTPLHLAVINCELKVVELLVRHGADVNVRGKYLDPPLLFCINRNHPEILEFLLANGACINNYGKYWNLIQMIVPRANTVDILKLLLKYGLRLNGKMNTNTTPLHAITSETEKEVIKILLDHNVKFNSADKYKLCPIHYAALAGHVDGVQLLIAKGVSVDCPGVNNWTPLFLAAAGGYGRLVEVLLLKGADVNKRDNYGQTPLFYVLKGLRPFTIQSNALELESLEKVDGLRPMKKSNESNTSSDAVTDDVYTIVTILIRNGAHIDLELFDGLQKIGDVILNGCKVSFAKLKVFTDLFKGAAENKDSLVKASIKEGTVVDCVVGKVGTPLMLACKSGSCQVVETLLSSGANPNFKTETGETPLHYAASQGDADVVISLLWKGAMYDAQNGLRRKPIHYAKKANNSLIVDLLRMIENLFHSAKNGDRSILSTLATLKNVYSSKRSALGMLKSKCLNQLNLYFVIKNSSGENLAQVAQANNNSMFVHNMWDTSQIK